MYWQSFSVLVGLTALLNLYLWCNGNGGSKQQQQHKLSKAGGIPAGAAKAGLDDDDDDSDGAAAAQRKSFKAFQRSFLTVYLLAMFSDWLQGPYIYALYSDYGYDMDRIALLFLVGFTSSMVTGTLAGSLADSVGRRLLCVSFAVMYFASCLTKCSRTFGWLMVGRLLGGTATSLLFTCFESWMVAEHNKRGYPQELLSETFALVTFGNSIVAVLAGLVAHASVAYFGTTLAPFLVALVPLFLVGVLASRWPENYGNSKVGVLTSLSNGWRHVRSDTRIACLGLGQAAFEGAMYVFVFIWTPVLTKANDRAVAMTIAAAAQEGQKVQVTWYSDYGEGLVFSCFMLACMLGSTLFGIIVNKQGRNVYDMPLITHALALLSTLVGSMYSEQVRTLYVSLLLFELSVGLFYPTYGTIKSAHIPEEARSSVANIFRIPLNAFVALFLRRITSMGASSVLTVCSLMHAAGFLFACKAVTLGRDKRRRQEEDMDGHQGHPLLNGDPWSSSHSSHSHTDA